MSTISASTTTTTAFGVTADTTGTLVIQTGATPTTALTISTSQNVTLAGTLTTTGITNSGVATATRFNPTGSSVTGNGMYLPAANSLGLSTNGTNALYIDSSQNVGIGITPVSQKLEVKGNQRLVGDSAYILWRDTADSASSGVIQFPSASVATIGTYVNQAMLFQTNNTERMRINSSGNVGIGTSGNISYKLSVNGSITDFLGYYYNTDTSTSSQGVAITTNTDNGATKLNWSAGATLLLSNDRYQTSDIVSKIVMNTANGGYNNGAIIHVEGSGTYNAGQLVFSTGWNSGANATERMRITNIGSVLVGKTVDGAGTNGCVLRASGESFVTVSSNVNTAHVYSSASSSYRFYVNENGGIYNYSANNSNLSDLREKKEIELAGNYLDKVCAIPVKTFLYNDQTDTDKNLGVIAQDVETFAPELVHETNWGTEEEPKMRLSIYQTDLQYALMKSIQELKAELDTVKAELAALRG